MSDLRWFGVPDAAGPLDAVVEVPGSKSHANRALALAALADGVSTLRGLPDGDDTTAMLAGVRQLGAHVDVVTARPDGSPRDAAIGGWPDGRPVAPGAPIDAALAGTTSRFLTGLAALGTAPITIDGAAPLRTRPMGPLHEALVDLGARVDSAQPGRLPVTVTGPARGGSVAVRGDVSSQFITALMMIGPCLADGLHIDVTTALASRPYVEITADVMGAFGIGVDVGTDTITVERGRYQAIEFTVEPDASSASYPLGAAAIRGGRITVPGLAGSHHGDMAFLDIARAMGATATVDPSTNGVVVSSTGALSGLDVDMADCSDLVPTVAALAVTATGPSRIRGVGFIRGKESDRLGDLAHELSILGADVDVTEDGLDIRPAVLHGGRLATHHDHRLALAFATLGTVVAGIELDDPDVVSKSWPSFWHDRTAWLAPS